MSNPAVLITGALTGIGRATALAFAKDGTHVVVSGRREAEGKELETGLRRLGAEAAFIRADVRREDDVRSLIDRTVMRFGRIDAPSTPQAPRATQIVDQSPESYAATFDTNVLGTLLSMKHELRVMTAQGSVISSTYGHEGAKGASIYAGSKHAVEGITKSAVLEAAGLGVRVNAVAPGPTETSMLNRFTGTAERKAALASGVPRGRVGQPDEIARDPVPRLRRRIFRDRSSRSTAARPRVDLKGRPADGYQIRNQAKQSHGAGFYRAGVEGCAFCSGFRSQGLR